jgi:hypothetical protein
VLRDATSRGVCGLAHLLYRAIMELCKVTFFTLRISTLAMPTEPVGRTLQNVVFLLLRTSTLGHVYRACIADSANLFLHV